MNKEQVRTITERRLKEWAEKCVEVDSTPALLLSIGHVGHRTGELNLFVPVNVSQKDVIAWLEYCLEKLSGKENHSTPV